MNFVVLAAAFVVFSAIVVLGVTSQVDDSASRYFKSIHGNVGLDSAMVVITTMGDVTTLFILGIILTIIRRTRKAGMIFLIALVVIAVLVMYMKPLFGREIPPYGFESPLSNFGLENDSLAPFAAAFSYPSGHASRTTALAFIVGFAIYQKSRKAGYAIWAFPIIIGITRLYVMQHYPTDIIGGFLFGGVISVALSNAMKLDQPFFMSRIKGKEDKPSQPSGNL
jgi:undecaprenyl-diphosphatase